MKTLILSFILLLLWLPLANGAVIRGTITDIDPENKSLVIERRDPATGQMELLNISLDQNTRVLAYIDDLSDLKIGEEVAIELRGKTQEILRPERVRITKVVKKTGRGFESFGTVGKIDRKSLQIS